MTQEQHILAHLQTRGTLTPGAALRLFDCARLAARVLDLKRKGVAIRTEKLKLPSGKAVAQYSLEVT